MVEISTELLVGLGAMLAIVVGIAIFALTRSKGKGVGVPVQKRDIAEIFTIVGIILVLVSFAKIIIEESTLEKLVIPAVGPFISLLIVIFGLGALIKVIFVLSKDGKFEGTDLVAVVLVTFVSVSIFVLFPVVLPQFFEQSVIGVRESIEVVGQSIIG